MILHHQCKYNCIVFDGYLHVTIPMFQVEQEAIALSRLGMLYHGLLTAVKYKAKDCLKRSIQLAHSLHPKTFHTESE